MNANPVDVIRVLIADDSDLVREGLSALLKRQQMDVVAEARDGAEAVFLYSEFRPDITLMDLRMPKMNGLAAIEAIIATWPEARIVVLTNLDGEEQTCLKAGARAVMLKDTSIDLLMQKIRDVHSAQD